MKNEKQMMQTLQKRKQELMLKLKELNAKNTEEDADTVLASYVIARKGLEFTEALPAYYERLLAQVGGVLKPRLKPSSPYRQWAQLHDLFKHYGVTPFKSPDPATNLQKNLLMALDTVLDGLNLAIGIPPDNLTAGLLTCG